MCMYGSLPLWLFFSHFFQIFLKNKNFQLSPFVIGNQDIYQLSHYTIKSKRNTECKSTVIGFILTRVIWPVLVHFKSVTKKMKFIAASYFFPQRSVL